jgi:DNA-binding XRE family transcriptional regulator
VYQELASLVTEGRARLGIDQVEFGRRVGVGQQSISRWERGQGRPRRSVAATIAAVLSLDVEQVLEAAGYVGAIADSAGEASLAVRPLVRGLPLHELAPDRFEDLCAELVQHLYPQGHASRFGGSGEKQRGIDVLVDGSPGPLAIVQCKRHRQFGPQDVRQAVADTDLYAPKNYLFLSRQTATAAARSEIVRHAGWELWDGEDIARYIRTRMGKEEAVRLVDTYFPNHRESFLGIARPGPWMTKDEFFAQSSGDQIYTHMWTLVGRAGELSALLGAVQSGGPGIVRLVGRGGLGKTRLLKAVAESFEANDWIVRFLSYGAIAQPADFELLSASRPVLLIVDDGHERSDIAEIFAHLRRRNPDSRLLVASRPYGEVALSQDLRRMGVLVSELPTVPISDLSEDEAVALAREASGGAHDAVVRRLADLTRDCPLATAVGGVLIQRGRLDPVRLEQDGEIRTAILRGFRDAVVAESLDGESDLRRAVLDGLAALQPFRSAAQPFQDTLAAVVGVPYHRIHHHLRSLEDAGVLLRRGDSLRIVPDLLGDVILAQACFDARSGSSTGFLAHIVEVASGETLSRVFVNVSRVDWQVRQQVKGVSLGDSLWMALEDEMRSADLQGLRAVLSLLGQVAYFQPERTLRLVRWILSNPTEEAAQVDTWLGKLYSPTWQDVLHEAAAVLRTIAYHFDFLTESCDLLWELAQTDTRPLHQHPDHPLRLLQDLAKIELSKPLVYNEAIIDIVSRWLNNEYRLSPLEVLEPLFATEGHSQTYTDYKLSFRPFALAPSSVLPLRQRVIDLATREAQSSNIQRAASGIKTLGEALSFPTGSFGRDVSDEERAGWVPNFLDTIRKLGQIAINPAVDSAIVVAIMEALYWHSQYGEEATSNAANEVLARLPDTPEFHIALLVHDGWGHLLRNRGESFETSAANRQERLSAVVRQVLTDFDDEGLVQILEHRLQVESEVFGSDASRQGSLVAALVKDKPPIARLIVDRVIAAPDSSLTPLLHVVLAQLGESVPDELVPTAQALLALQSPLIDSIVSRAFGWSRGPRSSLLEGELELLQCFAASADPIIRESAIMAAQRIAYKSPQEAIDLLLSASFSDQPRLAYEFFLSFIQEDSPLRWEMLTDTQQTAIRSQLIDLKDVSEYSLMTFLSQRSATDPSEVLEIFKLRIARAETLERLDQYRPIPFHWDVPLRVREHSDFLVLLRELHQWISEGHSWIRRSNGAELFIAAAGGFDAAVLALLQELLTAGSQASVEGVAAILREAPRSIIFTQVSFVLQALDAAARFGGDCDRKMRGALWAATVAGTRMGTPGEPFQEDLDQRDECAAIAQRLPKGSLGEKFYRALSEEAEESIRQELERDARDDHRQW